jgi:hypothetical protein
VTLRQVATATLAKTDGSGEERVLTRTVADKKPCVKGWRTLASTDADVIARWWREFPDASPALEMETCGLIVIDGDRHGGPDGVAALGGFFKGLWNS